MWRFGFFHEMEMKVEVEVDVEVEVEVDVDGDVDDVGDIDRDVDDVKEECQPTENVDVDGLDDVDVDGLDDVDVEAESQQTPDSADGLSQFLPCSNYLDWIENNSTHLQS